MQGGTPDLLDQLRGAVPPIVFMVLAGLLIVVGAAWFFMPLFVIGIYRGIRRLVARQAGEDRRRR